MFVGGAVVVAVVDSIANIVLCDTAPVVAGELRVGIARPEQAACLVAVVSAVVVVVTAVVVGDAPAIATSKHRGLAGVEGCETELRADQRNGHRSKAADEPMQWKFMLPDKAIKEDSSCGTACNKAHRFTS